MKFLSKCKAVALTVLLSIAALPAMAQSLTTAFNATALSQNGNIFDLTPSTNLRIDSFDINYESNRSVSPNATVEVYWREGTGNGYQNTAEGWQLLGSAAVVGNTWGSPTPVPVGGLNLVAGQTYGIYIRVVESDRYLAYTEGGPTTFSNPDLSLTTYFGVQNSEAGLLTGPTYYPRQWNGTVHYTKTQTCASEGYTGTKLEWCKNICERGYEGSTLNMWIRRWIDRYRILPYCAIEPQKG
jgi:hypothetical protein